MSARYSPRNDVVDGKMDIPLVQQRVDLYY